MEAWAFPDNSHHVGHTGALLAKLTPQAPLRSGLDFSLRLSCSAKQFSHKFRSGTIKVFEGVCSTIIIDPNVDRGSIHRPL
jgi:hypothetical protein